MRILIVLSALFIVSSGESLSGVSDFFEEAWDKTKEVFDSVAKYIFGENEKMVNEHNKLFNEGESSYKLELNRQFAYMNLSELMEKYTGLYKSPEGVDKSRAYYIPEMNTGLGTAPVMDWRSRGGVSPVNQQEPCRSCWAFSAVAAIEGHLKSITGKLTPLSPQHLVDCSSEFHNEGCGGGYQEYAFAYVAKNGGIASEKKYKYTGKDGSCQNDTPKRARSIKGFTTIPPKDEYKMKEIISNLGPLACSIATTNEFFLYNGGIFNDPSCNSLEPNHSVAVIGYGRDHWLIKNSWGHTWGENGYMRLAFNNWCNIASECSYPVFK